MTDNEVLRVLATFMDWQVPENPEHTIVACPDFLHDYDAVVPVWRRVLGSPTFNRYKVLTTLGRIHGHGYENPGSTEPLEYVDLMVYATPYTHAHALAVVIRDAWRRLAT